MFCSRRIVSLVAFLALLSAGPAFSPTPSDEATPEMEAAAPVALIYVRRNDGLNVYDAASNGKLTLLSGSPFKTADRGLETGGRMAEDEW